MQLFCPQALDVVRDVVCMSNFRTIVVCVCEIMEYISPLC